MTAVSSYQKNKGVFTITAGIRYGCKRKFGLRWFFLLVATFFPPHPLHVSAQEDSLKDGAALYSIGMGYEWMSDAYSSKGIALDIRARFYMSGRFFCELMGHWGGHEGEKNVMQKGKPFGIHDERNSLLGAVGPGYEIFQSGNQKIDMYVKGLVGYGIRSSRYDDYCPADTEDGHITLGCRRDRKGIAVVAGFGVDTRFKCWTLTPSVDVFFIGNRWNIAPMISFGFFL